MDSVSHWAVPTGQEGEDAGKETVHCPGATPPEMHTPDHECSSPCPLGSGSMAHILDSEPGTWGQPRPLSRDNSHRMSSRKWPDGSAARWFREAGAPGQSPEAWDDSEARQWAPENVRVDGLGLPQPCPPGADPKAVCGCSLSSLVCVLSAFHGWLRIQTDATFLGHPSSLCSGC